MTAVSNALYREALDGSAVRLRHGDGRCVALGAARWLGAARGADMSLLMRVVPPVLDVGCGPGRLAAALAARGIPVLGIDTAPEAVRLTRQAGACALHRSVFDPLPGEGRWGSALLADGNIGIGGDPVRLLRRVASLLRPDGRIVLEMSAPGGVCGGAPMRLETPDGRLGEWFPWGRVPFDAVQEVCREAGLRLVERWQVVEQDAGPRARVRWFAVVTRRHAQL